MLLLYVVATAALLHCRRLLTLLGARLFAAPRLLGSRRLQPVPMLEEVGRLSVRCTWTNDICKNQTIPQLGWPRIKVISHLLMTVGRWLAYFA